ncbi:hypothetical protein [Anaerotignum sp.]
MKRKSVGLLGIIFGGLTLSLELFLLRVIQGLEMVKGSWSPNVWNYAKQSPCIWALLLTAGILIFSLILIFDTKED